MDAEMTAASATPAATPLTARSAVSNGTRLLNGVDASRSKDARRYRDILDALLVQLPGAPSEDDLILARLAAELTLKCEERQAAMLRGEPTDETQANTTANTLRRLLADLRAGPRRRHPGKASSSA